MFILHVHTPRSYSMFRLHVQTPRSKWFTDQGIMAILNYHHTPGLSINGRPKKERLRRGAEDVLSQFCNFLLCKELPPAGRTPHTRAKQSVPRYNISTEGLPVQRPAGRTRLTWLCRWCGAGCGPCPCRAHAGTRRRASGRRGCRASSAARSLCRSCTGRKRGQL